MSYPPQDAPLLQVKASHWDAATANGNAAGTTIVSTSLASEPSYVGHPVKVLTGNANGQVRRIVSHPAGTNTITAESPFTDSAGAAVQIVSGTLFVVISDFDSDALFFGTTTSAGVADGSTLVDTSLATPFAVDDEPIGHTVRILTSGTAELVDQEREIYDYDFGTSTILFSTRFTAQVPTGTTYAILRDRPSAAGSPGPQPEPEVEEVNWRLADFDNFDVADATADTERWSSEYISAGAADGTADINTTTVSRLYVNITAAAVLANTEYGVRRRQINPGLKWFTKVDAHVTVTSPNANHLWAGLSVSEGIAWNASNYIRIYKRQDNVPVEGIAVERNIAGAGATTTAVLTTTQDNIAFKIERIGNTWRCYYSLTLAPRHNWVLALEIEDATNAMTDITSTYLSVRNPEDAVGQRITCDFDRWEYYETLGNLGDILTLINTRGGALAYIGYCTPIMAGSTTAVVCPNLNGFRDDCFNDDYQMMVMRNANAAQAAPEMEMRRITDYASATGTFTTEAFSANVEASDIVLVVHNSVAKNVSVFGIADAGSGVGTIHDAARTEAADWWNGQQVIMLSGAARGQVRTIWDFDAVADDILVSPDFDAAVAAGDFYAVLSQYSDIVPRAADDATDRLTSQVIGRKSDTAVYAKDTTSTIIRYLKGLTDATITAWGTADAGSGAGVIVDVARTEADDWWNSQTILMLTGAATFQKRPITDFVAATDTISVSPNFDAAVAAGNIYVILAHYNMIVPRAADDATNALISDVVGRKDDTALYSVTATASLVRYLKGSLNAKISATGTADAGSDADTLVDAALTQADDYWNGTTLLMLTGNNAGLSRPIVDFVAATDSAEIRPAFPAVIVAADVYVILSDYHEIVPAADSAENLQPRDVVGNKSDTVAAGSLQGLNRVPAADAATNTNARDVVGNKTDTIPAMNLAPANDSIVRHVKAILERLGATPADPDDSLLTTIGQRDDAVSVAATASAISLLRDIIAGLSIVAAGAGGGFEIDGTPSLVNALGTTGAVVTDSATSILGAIGADNANNAFASTSVVANIDGSVIERLEAISSGIIVGTGTFTASSATVPADTGQGGLATDYYKGCLLIPLTGAVAFQPRLIVSFTTVTGVFTLDAEEPFTAASGLVTYIIVAAEAALVPAANGANNTTTAHVVGNKTDAIPAMNLAPGTDSIVAHIKAILERLGATPADPDDSLLTNIGQRDDTATLDDMTNVTTTSIQAKLRRILLRMSSDAFTATIQGIARTELDTMLAQLATYLSAAGAAMALQVNGNAARTNLEQALTDFFTAFGCNGANVFNPTIQGAARTDLDTALNALSSYLTAAGAAMSIQVNGNAARANLEQAFEDLTVVFGADGANVFNPTVQGAARTDLDTALAQLATYFVAAGAAMALQVNNNLARTNLQQALNDYFAVVGCDGANVFNPTIQGAARTTLDDALAQLGTYFSAAGAAWSVQINGLAARTNLEQTLEDLSAVLGADGANVFNPTIQGAARLELDAALANLATYLSAAGAAYSAAVNPGAVAKTNIEQTLEDIGDMLAGATGIVTFPPAAAPADGVSLAEVVRQIYNDLNSNSNAQPRIQEVIIYPVAEDLGTTELTDTGASPAFMPAVAHSTAANSEAAPGVAWSEDVDFEQAGTITIISIYIEAEWQTRFLVGAGAGTQSSSKIQISRDAGANWVDVTENYNNALAVMTVRVRAGVGRWIPTIVAGANQLVVRLVHWTDAAGGVSTSEAQIRSNSYLRITYRKS